MLTLLINALMNRLNEASDRRTLRHLLNKDDRTLRDIGLARPDIEQALAKPFSIGAKAEAFRLSRIGFALDRA